MRNPLGALNAKRKPAATSSAHCSRTAALGMPKYVLLISTARKTLAVIAEHLSGWQILGVERGFPLLLGIAARADVEVHGLTPKETGAAESDPWLCSMAGMEETAGCPGCQRLQARVAELEGMVRDLAAQVKDLTAQLQGKSATIASESPTFRRLPPRSRPAASPAASRAIRRTSSAACRPNSSRTPLRTFRRRVRIAKRPCRESRSLADPEPTWHQVVELPTVLATVTEHQGHARTCPCCGEVTRAAIPADVLAHSVGPHLTGVIGYLTGDQGMSKRGVEELVEHVFGVPIGLGTVSNLEQEISAALAAAHTEATEAVRDAPVKNVDETGWKQNGQKRWLWLAATKLVAVFIIHPWRNLSALEALLGREFKGILCSDRWVVYNEWPDPFARQLCWAHLKRNWEALVERGGAAKRIGERFLAIQKQVFELWHLFRGGGCTRAELDGADAAVHRRDGRRHSLPACVAGTRRRSASARAWTKRNGACGRLWTRREWSRRTIMASGCCGGRSSGDGDRSAVTVPLAAASPSES